MDDRQAHIRSCKATPQARLVFLGIGHSLVERVDSGCQTLLKRQPFGLFGLLRSGADHCQLIENFDL